MNVLHLSARRARPFIATLLLCALAPAAAQDLKIGLVDVERIRQNSPQAEAAAQKLKSEFGPRQDHLQSLAKEVIELRKRLESDGDVMSEERRKELVREIQQKGRDLEREREEIGEDLAIRRNEEIGKFNERVVTVINEVASREGYDLVMQSATILHASKRIDITDLVLEELKNR